jgi:uncharacterized protein (TIGR04255 family)
MSYPVKISPCPIKEAIIELKFDSKLPIDGIAWKLVDLLKDYFQPHLQKLPGMDIPEIIRSQDENLKYQVHCILQGDNYRLNIAPVSISISCINEYTGWKNYLDVVTRIFGKIINEGFIDKVTTVGLRYISFFKDVNIIENSNIDFKIKLDNFNNSQSQIRTVLELEDGFRAILNLANGATIFLPPHNSQLFGALVDIDVIKENIISTNVSQILSMIDKAHTYEKNIFFEILNKDYLTSNFKVEH